VYASLERWEEAMMVRRAVLRWIVAVAAVLGILLLRPVRPALAGWWLVTLDQAVGEVQPGVPFSVAFTVISHSRAIPGLAPAIRVTHEAGEQVAVTARPEGAPGHYAAMLTLPTSGVWEWEIQPFPEGDARQVMSPITVRTGTGMAALKMERAKLPFLVRWLGLVLVLAGALLALLSQRGAWWARLRPAR
jgi:hypothetical protein